MPPLSMTGFGSAEHRKNSRHLCVDVRSVNHRFLDIRVKLPHSHQGLEEKIRRLVATRHQRGRVEVHVDLRGDAATGGVVVVNLDLVRRYQACFEEINQALQLDDRIRLADLIAQKDVIVKQEQSPDLEEEWRLLEPVVTDALAACIQMRRREGRSLQQELEKRLSLFSATVEQVERQLPHIVDQRQEELAKRLAKLRDGVEVDPQRLAQEVAILADKSDVTEELVRLRSHLRQFTAFLGMDEPVGRRLDFLLQEFLREVNTLASKINNSEVAHLTVALKSEIEKIREQVQNIE